MKHHHSPNFHRNIQETENPTEPNPKKTIYGILFLFFLFLAIFGKSQSCYSPYQRESKPFNFTATLGLSHFYGSDFIGGNAGVGFSGGEITMTVNYVEWRAKTPVKGKYARQSAAVTLMHDVGIGDYWLTPFISHGTNDYNNAGVMFRSKNPKRPAFIHISTMGVSIGMFAQIGRE